ncbi:MAG TPA: hypothetical protein VGT81_19040 [Casimicrobiaceae bacterium]|nr:hypothetical protein [Casimicrobiaceae bacterium]
MSDLGVRFASRAKSIPRLNAPEKFDQDFIRPVGLTVAALACGMLLARIVSKATPRRCSRQSNGACF